MRKRITYLPGEKHCERCGTPLGRIRCTARKRRFLCKKKKCNYPQMTVPIQFIGPGRLCDGPNCSNPVPSRAYPASRKNFFCSKRCEGRFHGLRGPDEVSCARCDKELGRRKPVPGGLHYCGPCSWIIRREAREVECCGPFLEVFRKYREEFADVHYRGSGARNAVLRFLNHLKSAGLTDIKETTIEHIDRFLDLAGETCQKPRIEYVKVFFDFLIERDLFDDVNPVDPETHYSSTSESEPKIYDQRTIEELWSTAANSPDGRVALVFALGEESGPQMYQLCNMRIADIVWKERRVFLRDADGQEIVGWTPYDDKTDRCLRKWLDVRPRHRSHDFLLTNEFGDPLKVPVLTRMLNRTFAGKVIPGFGKFSYPVLRHSNMAWERENGIADEVNMQFHSVKCVETIERFDMAITQRDRTEFDRTSTLRAIGWSSAGRGAHPDAV